MRKFRGLSKIITVIGKKYAFPVKNVRKRFLFWAFFVE